MIAFVKRIAPALLLAALFSAPAVANDLPRPEGEVILTVTGDIAARNDGDRAVFDAAMLQALGEVSFDTSTPWTDGVLTFTGVPLLQLMQALGVTDGTLKATAINDYAIEIPVADAVDGGPILAYKVNGKEMSIREKGPLWVVYPYDQNKDYQAEVIFSRSIWQLVHLDVTAD